MPVKQSQVDLKPISNIQEGWEKKALHVAQLIRESKSLNKALETLVEQTVTALKADRCFVFQFDENHMPMPVSIEARSGDSVSSFIGLTPPWHLCPYLKRTSERKTAWSNDVQADSLFMSDESLRALACQYDIRGLIAIPIVFDGEILCVLVAQTLKPHEWTEGEILFAQVSSSQAALSLYQDQLKMGQERYQKLYEWEKKTREVLQVIRQSIDTDKVFPVAIAEMAKALNANRAFIIEFEGGKVCPIRYEYRSHDSVKPFTGIVPPWDFCPYLAVSAKNEMAWSKDTYNDPDFEGNDQWYHFSRKYTIRSIVTSPILYKDNLMNVIVFHTEEPRHWTEQERFFIKVVGDQLSTLFYQEKVREELIRAAQIKSDFLSKMSHELRTPLNSIIGYAKMVEKGMVGPLNAKQAEYMQYVGSSGQHLLNLVNDLLDFSKIEAGKMTLFPQEIQLDLFIDEIKAMMENVAESKGVQLSLHLQPNIGVIHVDSNRLKQILINLISNAIKFNRENGSVNVRFNKSDDQSWIICEVQDTGIGIPEHKLPELFNQFHQVDNSPSRKHEGTGLGLVLSKELIELHGGQITVESQEGEGTTFTFKVPVTSPTR